MIWLFCKTFTLEFVKHSSYVETYYVSQAMLGSK